MFSVTKPEYKEIGKVIREVSRLGYDGIEWRIHPDYHISLDALESKAGRVRAISERHGLNIAALGGYVDCHNHGNMQRLLNAAACMQCPAVRIASPKYDGRDAPA